MKKDEKLIFKEQFNQNFNKEQRDPNIHRSSTVHYPDWDIKKKEYVVPLNKRKINEMNDAIKSTPEYKIGKKLLDDEISNSNINGIDYQDIMNIIVDCDDFTNNDSDFFEAFTNGVFEHFGWTYLHKENIHDEQFGFIDISESSKKLLKNNKK